MSDFLSWPWQLFVSFDEWDCGAVMIHPIWSLSASHCFPGMEWSARSSQLHATLYALGRNAVSELTDHELHVLELSRSEAEELESERAEKDDGYTFQVILLFISSNFVVR